MAVPYQVLYTNQLQFNLGVPLTTQNLAVQFNRPSPIFVERVGGQHGIPTTFVQKQASGTIMDSRGGSVGNYSSLSEDRMEMMSVLAKRDLRNRKLQSQIKSQRSESLSPACSPSRSRQKGSCERFAREEILKPRKPLTAKQADKNRRLGAVQTPPPPRPVSRFKSDNSMVYSRNTSMNVTRDSDVSFPVKPIIPEGDCQPRDEIEKLQLEVEGYLLLMEQIGERSLSEPGFKFLHPPGKGKQKDEFLNEEENMDRVRVRIEEQNIRLTRNLYNLKLKVKQVQRDVAHADLSKSTKKSQILSQFSVVYRGALKALQTFVNQLPHNDLSRGLPLHFHELAQLLRQLTALSALVKQGKPSENDSRFLAVLDRVNNLNTKWSMEHQKKDSVTEKKDKKSAMTKDWVSDTKVDKDIFVMKNQPEFRAALDTSKFFSQPPRHQVQRGRLKKRAPGKENKGKDRSELRSAITTLLQPKTRTGRATSKELQTNSGVTWEVGMGRQPLSQDHRKGYLLPYDLIAQREKAQRAVALSNQEKRYADPTFATSLKKSPARPSSAPENVRHKGVNFEFDHQSPMPWIPPGRLSRSRSLSSEPKSQSRSPFYLHDMSTDDVRCMFPDKQSLRTKKMDSNIPRYELQSLPTERKLRSADVSNSFIDKVEHRLLQRMMDQATGRNMRSSKSGSVPDLSPQKDVVSADSTIFYSDIDEPLETSDLIEGARLEAVSAMDVPTIKNMRLRLAEMQQEQREIRQRWSTLKFVDTQPKSRLFASCDIQSEKVPDPPAIEVRRMYGSDQANSLGMPVSNEEWKTEPVIFTKSGISSRVSYHDSVDRTRQNEPSLAQVRQPKKLVTLKQTAVEKISADRDRFQSYLRKHSHHPSGKFDPWKLVEEISDEILSDCLADVANEVDLISEEIANHMYKSEFVVDKSQLENELHKEHSESHVDESLVDVIQHQPISEGVDYKAENVRVRHNKGMGEMFFELKSGDQHKTVDAGKSEMSQELSATRSYRPLSTERLSPILSAAEPMLENISHLLHKEGKSSERGSGFIEPEIDGKKEFDNEDDKYEDNYEESSKEDNSNDDDDDDSFHNDDDSFHNDDDGGSSHDYEQDDFEDVTVSELEKL